MSNRAAECARRYARHLSCSTSCEPYAGLKERARSVHVHYGAKLKKKNDTQILTLDYDDIQVDDE